MIFISIMNTEILNAYNISFLTDHKGNKHPDGKTALSSYLDAWRDLEDIDDFLTDINLCLNGDFSEIKEPYYHYSMIKIYGELTLTSLILSGTGHYNSTAIPLVDFKEILLSWREFLLL